MNLLSLSPEVIEIIRSLGDPINSHVVDERRLRHQEPPSQTQT